MISARVISIKADPGGDAILMVVFEDVYERQIATVSLSLMADGEMAVATLHPGDAVVDSTVRAGEEMKGVFVTLRLPPKPDSGPLVVPPEWLPPRPPDDENREGGA